MTTTQRNQHDPLRNHQTREHHAQRRLWLTAIIAGTIWTAIALAALIPLLQPAGGNQ